MSKIVDWWNSTKTFSTEKLHRARKMKFWRYHLILLPDCSKVFTQEPELLKKRTFSRKKNRPISFSMRRKELRKTCQKNASRPIFFLVIVRKSNNKPDTFLQNTVLPKISQLIRGILFWQICLTHSTKWLKGICLISQNHGRKKLGLSPKLFHGAIGEQVWQRSWKILLNRLKLFLLIVFEGEKCFFFSTIKSNDLLF